MNKPIWAFCPICDKALEGMGQHKLCRACGYDYQQEGSYAATVTINGEDFWLDDMFSDYQKLTARIAELRTPPSIGKVTGKVLPKN